MRKKLLQSSFVLISFSVAAGVLNYVYQILAAQRLTAIDLGRLNVNLSYFNIAMVLGVVLQYSAVFYPCNKTQDLKMKRISWGVLGISWIAVLAAFVFWGRVQAWMIFVATWLPLSVIQYWTGRFQALESFVFMGGVGLVFSLFRVAFGSFSKSVESFSLALLLAACCTLGILLKMTIARPASEEAKVDHVQEIFLAALVGFASVLLPALDLLNVRYGLGVEEAGVLSRVQLFSKALFYLPMTLLQVTLPGYVREMRRPIKERKLFELRKVELGGLLLCYLAAVVVAVVAPSIGMLLFKGAVISSRDVFFACLSIIPFYGLLASIQIEAACKNGVAVVALILLIAISPFGAFFLSWTGVSHYLVYAAIVNTGLGAIGLLLTSRTLKQK